ncbi:cyclic di-GMP phosphodiesterase Gmr [mine drainage metagenome]|uniref:Cyclic di-GMP phosphodiesterase Gmr n=1 Tax=mine drainage metagenome TaxID=410659 RepID=A0A1J5S0U8_9ZZZZ
MADKLLSLSLKTRVLLVVLGLFIIGIWGLAARVAGVMQADLERLLSQQMLATVTYVAVDLDDNIQMRIDNLREIARSTTPALLADSARLRAQLARHGTARVLFPTGVFVADRDGTNIADYPLLPGRVGASIGNRTFFKEIVASGHWAISEPLHGRFSKQPIVALGVPIKDASGAVAGVLVGSAYPSDHNLFGRLEKTRIGRTGYFLVISPKDRVFVSATDQHLIMQPLPARGVNPLLDRRIENGFEGAGVVVNSRGIEVLTASHNMRTTGWIVVAAVATEEAFAPIATLKRQIYLAALAMSLALALVLRWVLARQLAPLNDAGKAMRRMTDGDEAFAPIAVTRNDEIGELVGNFNRLVLGRRAAEDQIELLAYHDALTGLPNRRLVQDRFVQATAYADRAGTKVALLFLDLDNFKTINDSLGHQVGDALLKEVAARLAECVRDTDTISRQGGDEFLIVLPDLPDADATAPALVKIRERLQEPVEAEGQELATSASIGVALYPDDGEDFDTLLKKADTAMYRAKDAGRNTYRFFDEQMNVEAVLHLTMRNGLRRALDRGELVLHYQPQVELTGGTVVGVEALIRWQHPELGMVPPARFIPIAEESGLIVPIGEWVMREACRQAVAWKKAGLPNLTMAVNLSAVQFKRGDVLQTVVSALEETGFDPHHLELEMTESILIRNTESVLAAVGQLKLLGVTLSIDDFGTGYSSLSYLKRFAVDKLKIDQSFIRDLATDPDDAAIVRAIIQMAGSLGLKTLAEGVEDAATLAQLAGFGCDEVQGFLYARPMPAEELPAFLAAMR